MRYRSFFISLTAMLVLAMTSGFSGKAHAQTPQAYSPQINPSDFSTTITNKYFNLVPGKTYFYEKQTDEGKVTEQYVVTNLTRDVMGVKTLVVWDRFWLNGSMTEEAYDWYAQAKNGDVWYFGEESREYENGKVKDTKGSWEAGINGAKPGIIMRASPKVGDSYYQEYAQGVAEDRADVVATGQSITTPYGPFNDCLKTYEYTALDPTLKEYKYACTGIGKTVATRYADDPKAKEDLTAIKDNIDFLQPVVATTADSQKESEGAKDNKDDNTVLWVLVAGVLGVLTGWVANRFLKPKPNKDATQV